MTHEVDVKIVLYGHCIQLPGPYFITSSNDWQHYYAHYRVIVCTIRCEKIIVNKSVSKPYSSIPKPNSEPRVTRPTRTICKPDRLIESK